MKEILSVFNFAILVYFGVVSSIYIALTIVAFRSMRRHVNQLQAFRIDDIIASGANLPISVIVPAFNEASTIADSVRSLLSLQYPNYEVIVVNDGSSDGTLTRLRAAFELSPTNRAPTSSIETAAVRGLYRSRLHPTLFVVDKENGGKADALNAGLNLSRGAILCALDADTLLESDALARIARPFLENASTVAVGGIVRIANGSTIDGGSVTDVRLPRQILPRLQVLEYLRAFLSARVGWDALNSTLIISGAFGAFRRSMVGEVGGYDTNTVGEDMELVVRLHRHCRDTGTPYRISFIPDPVAWTEVPTSLGQLSRQRNRWQRGLGQVLVRHRSMILRPRYGTPGMLGLPFLVVFELIAPVVELAGWLALVAAILMGAASPVSIAAFLALAVFMGSAISLAAVALEELSFRRYHRLGDLTALLGVALIESFGYRQLTAIWRLQGLVAWVVGDTTWGEMHRKGFDQASERGVATSRS